jgi:hypothetical protein
MADTHTPYGVLASEQADKLLHVLARLLDRHVLAHSRRWHVVGIFMRCTSCGHPQKATQSAQPFAHAPDCRATTRSEDFPWREWATILRQLPIDRPTNVLSTRGNHS